MWHATAQTESDPLVPPPALPVINNRNSRGPAEKVTGCCCRNIPKWWNEFAASWDTGSPYSHALLFKTHYSHTERNCLCRKAGFPNIVQFTSLYEVWMICTCFSDRFKLQACFPVWFSSGGGKRQEIQILEDFFRPLLESLLHKTCCFSLSFVQGQTLDEARRVKGLT